RDVEGAGGRAGQAAVTGGQGVAGAHFVDGQGAETGDARDRRYGCGPAERAAAGVAARATGTLEEEGVTRLPDGSRTRTVTAGLMAWPAIALLGCTLKARWTAAAGVMLKKAEVPAPRLPSVAARV